ncbi:MAG TPA: anhydro-N-acetylmuramic acid kinase [Thermomicrobiales bacterium]|nr:anhydro-N-acetylmuramic acid kinase [Thermomicrobiales bacterium]
MIEGKGPQDEAEPMLCLGLISGTSADGIDAALVNITGAGSEARLDLVAASSTPYPEPVRDELLALYDQPEDAIARLCSLNFVVGDLFADAALALCREAGIDPSELHVVGSHGQTVWHEPAHDPRLPLSRPSTLQIGEAAVIAERLGAPVLADFRVADMAAGGQGAPLAPYFDWVVLRHPDRHRAVQNIGGIGNVTDLPAGARLDEVRAFDTGPGNILIDGMVTLLSGGRQTYDRDGALAAEGTVDEKLLRGLLADAYLQQPPPKTTGRERYGIPMCREIMVNYDLSDNSLDVTAERARGLIATVTALTARSIADAYERWLPGVDEVIVGGGGARNRTLMGMLASAVAPVPVTTLEDHGLDSDAKEAMFFALMARDALAGLPTNVPSATGARHPATLGKLVLPIPRSFG